MKPAPFPILPPCMVCGIPANLMGTRAERIEHARIQREKRREERRARPGRERAAADWFAARTWTR